MATAEVFSGIEDLSESALADLRASGLSDGTIHAMRVRMVLPGEMPGADGGGGYVIPYFIPGEDDYVRVEEAGVPFLRVRATARRLASGRIVQPFGSKYLQSKGSGTHAYIPPIPDHTDWMDTSIPIIITEGEKKAAKATQEGFLSIGLGGIDAWASTGANVPNDRVQASAITGHSRIVLTDLMNLKFNELVCDELMFIPWEDRLVTIIFDSDVKEVTKANVFRAAFNFGIWLEKQGAAVRSVVLPSNGKKLGLDDYLITHSPRDLQDLIDVGKFPLRPGVRSFVQRELRGSRRSREVFVKVARAVLSNLDHRGKRYCDKLGNYFYFDDRSKTLFTLPYRKSNKQITTSKFLHFLVKECGLSTADNETMVRLLDGFEAIEPIHRIERTYTGSTTIGNTLYYQLSDSTVAKVDAHNIQVVTNGTDGVLFENQNSTVETKLVDPPTDTEFGWVRTLRQTSLLPLPGFTQEETYVFVACLCYLSPWLRRWNGLMLPAELAISEPGSGKTSLYQLRKAIFSGSAGLNQPPKEMRDWYATIANTSAMYVGDNIGHTLEETFSNEIARLITDPEPTVELRELYTTTDVAKRFIDCVFAFTSIYNAFGRPDLIQRSMIFEFAEIQQRDGTWMQSQLKDGGRELWVSHHLDIVQRFFNIAPTLVWSSHSAHRLVHFEQSMRCMGFALGQGAVINSALGKLPEMAARRLRQSDPIMEALATFVMEIPRTRKHSFTAGDIYEWIENDDYNRFDSKLFKTLGSSRSIARYIKQHASDVRRSTGITPRDDAAITKDVFYVDPTYEPSP